MHFQTQLSSDNILTVFLCKLGYFSRKRTFQFRTMGPNVDLKKSTRCIPQMSKNSEGQRKV